MVGFYRHTDSTSFVTWNYMSSIRLVSDAARARKCYGKSFFVTESRWHPGPKRGCMSIECFAVALTRHFHLYERPVPLYERLEFEVWIGDVKPAARFLIADLVCPAPPSQGGKLGAF